ncbi:MAG: SEL1-like repeat protein, partial [Lentisphaeria bacterium]|nr:SEL1-like repeat protein [Lentisphaeria bacterium]
HNLGVCYENGDGVEQDYAEAVKWIRRAAEQGFEPAKEALKEMEN